MENTDLSNTIPGSDPDLVLSRIFQRKHDLALIVTVNNADSVGKNKTFAAKSGTGKNKGGEFRIIDPHGNAGMNHDGLAGHNCKFRL